MNVIEKAIKKLKKKEKLTLDAHHIGTIYWDEKDVIQIFEELELDVRKEIEQEHLSKDLLRSNIKYSKKEENAG
jgi:hypothetical protein